MEARTFETLELDALVRLLAGHVQSPLGRKRALALRPSTDLDHLNRELDRTSECADYFTTGGAFGLGDLRDPEESLRILQIVGTGLDPHQILDLQTLIAAGLSLREQFNDESLRQRYPQLALIARAIPDLRRVLAEIRGKILPTGEIDDSASPALRRIRREINQKRSRIYRSLESLMKDRGATTIQEEIVTIRNGRFVIPVRTDARGQVPGVMHGLSSSGQTTFVEPLTVIDQNNEMVRLQEEEEIEIANILLALTETLRANLDGLHQVIAAIAEIDFAQAKARLSIAFHSVRPQLHNDKFVRLKDVRHPLLEHLLKAAGASVVPISLELDDAHQTMVISGPNAGGKTVVVKTVGLITLMAQMGLHVPAREAVLPVFGQVLADIGDHQSIAANLSTFTAHMKNIAEMAASIAPPALILLDEVGTGTDPDEGAALGVAIVEHFKRAGATVIATTHYNPLKAWASQTAGVLNASVEFDQKTLRPTYRLLVGLAGASAGIEIARRMNLPETVIAEASRLLDPAQRQATDYLRRLETLVTEHEALTQALEDERAATAEKFTKLDLEFAQREAKRRTEFEQQLADVIREFTTESARLLNTVKDKVTAARLKKEAETRAAELRRSAAMKLVKQAASSPTGASAESAISSQPVVEPASSLVDEIIEIRERDRVLLKALDREGVVESISGETFHVLVGSLRFRAKRDELMLIKSAEPVTSKRAQSLPSGVSADVRVDENFESELNVIGLHADEATERLDKFLDAAYLAGADSIRIVHGMGKGVLRNAIAEMLKKHPHVQSFQPAPANQGGAGATLAILKK